VFIRGSNILDVDGEGSKDYKLNFLALKQGVYKFRLTFMIKESGEYMFYNFAITVGESTDTEEISLVSPIRESTTYQVVLENPTDSDVKVEKSQFTLVNENIPAVDPKAKAPAKGAPAVDPSADNDNIEILPQEFVLKPHEAKEFTIKFRPLIITEKDEYMLTLKHPILGDYKYKLLLKAIAPTTQRSLAFKCPLGQD